MKTTSALGILEMLRNGYEEVDALTDKERHALPDAFRLAAVACSAWNYNNGFQDYALDAMQHAAAARDLHAGTDAVLELSTFPGVENVALAPS